MLYAEFLAPALQQFVIKYQYIKQGSGKGKILFLSEMVRVDVSWVHMN